MSRIGRKPIPLPKGVTYADFQRANVMPTRNLLDALRDALPNVRRFVHVSSLASYAGMTIQLAERRAKLRPTS